MKTEELLQIRECLQEHSRAIGDLAMISLELDVDSAGAYHRYSEEDLINALITFNHVASNILIHNMMDKNTSMEEGGEKGVNFGDDLHKLIKKHLDINTKTCTNQNQNHGL